MTAAAKEAPAPTTPAPGKPAPEPPEDFDTDTFASERERGDASEQNRAADPEPVSESAATRTYHVLKSVDFDEAGIEPDSEHFVDGAFTMVGSFKAHGDQQAIRLAAKTHGIGDYVAVPERSWHEKKVELESVEPRLKLS